MRAFIDLATLAAFVPLPAMAGQAGMLLPSTLLGEAAVVALAFTLPALVAGAYLLIQRLWAGARSRVGLTIITIGALACAALVSLGFDIPSAGRLLALIGT